MNVHFSSQSNDWATPQETFDLINGTYGPFDLDVAASASNAKCPRFFTLEDDGLSQSWAKRNWCNPPYSQLKKWVQKAVIEATRGNTTVMLIPARTETAVFHDHIYRRPGVEIVFLRGRLKFGSAKHNAPFPSMVVVFNPLET